ncbi:MAG TPA: hypothetical protein VFA00_10595 [Actinomycetota bacterium]|nr:hypothetical protein [Actinomycetota bacterium]
MSTCITAVGVSPFDPAGMGSLSLQGMYPVLDPRRTAGPGPHKYGYNLARDALVITVARDPELSNCEMKVNLVTTLFEPKEIQAFNFSLNAFVAAVGTSAGLDKSMKIQRRTPGMSCASGVDTLVLARQSWGHRKAFYWFPPDDLWDFWGGCTVTFDWFRDDTAGPWGDATPAPRYPLVRLPDGTVMEARRGGVPVYYVVFGGAAFEVKDPAYLAYLVTLAKEDATYLLAPENLSVADALASETAATNVVRLLVNPIPFQELPVKPVDGTLVREWMKQEVYVCFGGAKFQILDSNALFATGFDWRQVRVIPPGGTSQLGEMPYHGTLLAERSNGRIYLAVNDSLSWVTSRAAMVAHCLPFRHVRIVPDNTLAGLKKGNDIS